MKKILTLMIVTIIVTSVSGCGCCRRLRDMMCRGAYCGAPAALLAPIPAPLAPAPLAACSTCPPQAMAYSDPSCGYTGMQTLGYGGYEGSPMMVDSGWSNGCTDCQGGVVGTPSYDMPSYNGDQFLVDPNASTGTDPGPAIGVN